MSHVRHGTLAILATALCLVLLGFRCGEPSTASAPASAPPVARPKPDLRLMLLTDPRGYLEPCGCQQRPLGGVDKLAATVAKARAEGIPLLVLAAGDLTFGTTVHGDDAASARTEELWRAQTLIDSWNSIGMAAVTPGALDFGMGPEAQQELAKRSKFPWLVENLVSKEDGDHGLTKARILQAGPHKVGVFGVIAPSAAIDGALKLDLDIRGIAKRTVTDLRKQGAQLVVALVSGDRRAAREVASAGADFVVMGGLDLEEPLPPSKHHGATLLHAGRQGQRVLTLNLATKGTTPFRDASEWTYQAARAESSKRIKDLEVRIAEWAKDARTKPEDLAEQRSRLAAMKSELSEQAQTSYDGRWLSASIVDLAPEIEGNKQIAARMDAFDKRINQHNREALKDRVPVPAPLGTASYVGSESCKGCHAAAHAWWRGTKHGHAYATLEKVNKEFSLACVGCHVTGYNQPGGSTVTHVEQLKDVGCESCHGPSSLHNADPKKAGLVQRDTNEATCKGCHNLEHSSRFQYDAFHSMLIAPGHGMPVPSSAATK